MSDDESNHSGSESEQEEVKPAPKAAPKKQKEISQAGLDDSAKELLEVNRQERDKMEEEIQELRKRSEKRKKQREAEEKRLAAERVSEDEKRKAVEEAKKKQKSEEEERKQKERALKMAELEKYKTPQKRNFVITRKDAGEGGDEEEEGEESDKGHKTKEQLDAEKKAILKQRIKQLDIDGLDAAKLAEKAKEFHQWLTRLEGERYDLEKRFKSQQAALVDLAERARQVNKVGKGGLKRVGGAEDDVDKIQQRFAGAPAKVEMFSKYERQKDKRSYSERFTIFTGPQFISPAERIKPNKAVEWDGERMPVYTPGAAAAVAAGEAIAAAE